MEPVGPLASQDLDREVERQVVRVRRGMPIWPTRISVCTESGLSITTTRRVGSGGSRVRGGSMSPRGMLPNTRSAAANASSRG
jgi:hypothetical protein